VCEEKKKEELDLYFFSKYETGNLMIVSFLHYYFPYQKNYHAKDMKLNNISPQMQYFPSEDMLFFTTHDDDIWNKQRF
jgi:hypothetical protein